MATTPREQLQNYLRAPFAPQLIYVAVKLGLPEWLQETHFTSDELAHLLQVHGPSLRRALRGMVAVGLLTHNQEGRFGFTEMGALLCRDHPDSLHDNALISGELYPAWCRLLDSVRTGETAFDMAFGQSLFTHFSQQPVLKQSFNRHMAGMTDFIAQAAISTYSR